MIGLPIIRWTVGDDALPAGIAAGVLLQIAAVLMLLAQAWGVRRTLILALIVAALAWAVEYIGHTTGFPFGAYDYTARLQPQLGGVPLLIPLAWLMMLPSSWAVARVIAGANRASFIVISALAMTAWDLFLDPQMVAWNLWQWEHAGVFTYFGIPWGNFAGWLLASGAITALALPVLRLDQLPLAPLILIYVITWLLEAIGQWFFWGLPASGTVGFLAMGGMLLWVYKRGRVQSSKESKSKGAKT